VACDLGRGSSGGRAALNRRGSHGRGGSRLVLRERGKAEPKTDDCNRDEGAIRPELEQSGDFQGGILPFLRALKTCVLVAAEARLASGPQPNSHSKPMYTAPRQRTSGGLLITISGTVPRSSRHYRDQRVFAEPTATSPPISNVMCSAASV
jgi:hypothetical protein